MHPICQILKYDDRREYQGIKEYWLRNIGFDQGILALISVYCIAGICLLYWRNTCSCFYVENAPKIDEDYEIGNKFIDLRWAVWYHSYYLKNVKNTHGGLLLLVKLQALAYISCSLPNADQCPKWYVCMKKKEVTCRFNAPRLPSSNTYYTWK